MSCGNGWWRIGNRGKQLWPAGCELLAETKASGTWAPVAVLERIDVAGRVRLDAREKGPVRLTAAFLPLERILEAAGWRMDVGLAAPTETLNGGVGVPAKLVSTTIELHSPDGPLGSGVGPFYLSLPSGSGFYHAVASTAIADGDVLRVTADPHSVRHVDERARP